MIRTAILNISLRVVVVNVVYYVHFPVNPVRRLYSKYIIQPNKRFLNWRKEVQVSSLLV